jgi:hypothetical protein
MSKRAKILLADAVLVIVTGATVERSRTDVALVVVLTCAIMIVILSYIAIGDMRLLKRGAVPQVHFQIPVGQVLREPLVSRQLGEIGTKWIRVQARGYLGGHVALSNVALQFKPDWIARKDGFTTFDIPLSSIAGFERIRLAGEVVDAFALSLEQGSILRFEMRQADFVERRLRQIGLVPATRIVGAPPPQTCQPRSSAPDLRD